MGVSLQWNWSGLSKSNGALPAVRTAPGSTGIGWTAGTQSQPEIGQQVHSATNRVVSAVQKAQAVETFCVIALGLHVQASRARGGLTKSAKGVGDPVADRVQ